MNETILELLDEFIEDKTTMEDTASSTIRNYKISILTFVKRTGAKTIADFNFDNLRKYFFEGRTDTDTKKWNVSTLNEYMKRLNVFGEWCVDKNYL